MAASVQIAPPLAVKVPPFLASSISEYLFLSSTLYPPKVAFVHCVRVFLREDNDKSKGSVVRFPEKKGNVAWPFGRNTSHGDILSGSQKKRAAFDECSIEFPFSICVVPFFFPSVNGQVTHLCRTRAVSTIY